MMECVKVYGLKKLVMQYTYTVDETILIQLCMDI